MAYNISLNNITTTTAPVQQELSGISLQTSASALPRVDIQPNVNEHQLPQALSPSDSCLENEESSSQQPEVKKEQAEKKKKVHKKSNKYSNHTKAKGHLAAIAGATTLGAVLAPFTGGLSLLPTAFVVLFGNASALAMYGGSEFVLGQKGPNNQIDDKKDPEANKQPEENKQPEISVPVSPRPIRAQEFRGLDEVNGRREPEPEEKGSRGKGDTFNYSPVFNFNFGDLNFNQFNTQNNTQFNTQNNTDKTNQADTDSSPTLIEQTIEKFGGNPVINVEEITKDVLIRELREQEPLIGPESKVDEMIDALVSFHEQTNEAKLIQVSFESGHKAYIGGIPDTDEQKQTDPIKAEVCVEKAKKQWPEVKPAHRLITTSGNAKIDGNPGYRNARVDVDGQTVGYTRNERGGSQPQSSGVHTSQGSQQPGVEPSPVDPGHGASGAASVQPGGEAKGAQTPSLHTQGEPISTATQTGGAQGTQGGEDDGRPQVAQGHNPQGEPASLAKAGTPVDPGHGASDVASAQPGGEAKGAQTPSLHTQGEPISTATQTGGAQGTQGGEDDGRPQVAQGHNPQGEPASLAKAGTPVDPGHGASDVASAQPGGEAKGAQTPSLHTQGEPISTATQTGGAQGTQGGEDDGRPQVAQGHNPQGEPASLAKAGTPVDPGHGASDVASAQPGGEAKGAQTPSLQTEGESISTSMPTGEEQGVQTGGVKKWPEVAAPQRVITSAGNAKIDGNPGYRNARVDVDGQTVGYTRNERGGSQPQSSGVHTSQGSQQPGVEPSPVDPGHGASGAASVQPGGEAKGAQTPSLHTQGEPISTATQTGGAQGTQGGEDDGRPQVAQGHNPQGEPASLAKAGTPVDPGHGASDVASAQPGGEAKGAQTPSLQTEGESISTSMPTGEEQGVQTGGVKKWPEVAAPQRVITSAGNAKIDGNPGYRNARVDVDGQTVGYTRNERGGSQPQSSGVHTSQGSQQPGVEPSPVDPGHGASGAASVQPGGEAKGAQTPSLHTQGEPISTATQTGGAQGTQGGEDDGRPQVAQGHNPQGEPASLAKAGTPVDPGHGASDVASAQPGGEAKGAQTPSLHTQGEPISTATQTGGAQGTQGGEDDGRPQVAQGHNPQGEPASLAKAGTPVDPGHGASDVASAQPGGEAKGAQTPSLHTQGEPISTATQTGGAQGTQGGEDDGRPQVAQGHNPQGEPASLAKAGTPVDPGHGASDVASAQPGGEAKGAQTPSLQTEGESISTSMPTGEEQGVQTGGVKKWPEVAAPQRVITSAGNAKIDGNPGYRNARVDVDGQTVGYTRNERGGSQPQSSGVHTSQGSQQPGVEPSPVDPGHGASGAASVQPGGEAKGAQTPSLHTQGEPISTATQTGGAQGTQGGEDDGRPQVAQGHNPQGEPASLAKAGTPVDPGHGASDVASAQPGGEAKGAQTPSLQTEGESISTSMPTGEEQGVQTGGVKKWPEVAAPQRVITSAGNAKIDGNPGYRNARVDVDGQTVGYTRNERGGSQPQSSGVHTSQGSQQPGVEPSPVDPGHGASGAASVQPGGEAKGAQTPSLHTQGEPISTATQTGGAQNIQSVTLARADLQQTNVERGRITDVTKLVDVKALASTVAANKSEPERFVSKLHITLKGNSSADSKVGTNQPESLQAWSSNMLSPGPGVKLAQKSLVQNEIELMPQANKGETVKKIEVVSNISGKKWTVSMPAPVLTTQGMASGRGKNYTQGLFHNIRDINQTKRNIELNSTLMESTPKSDVSFVNMGDKVFPIKPAIISNLKLVS
ncbi:hypothetical protein ACSTJ8_22040 [Vibrio parahaemolyticus]